MIIIFDIGIPNSRFLLGLSNFFYLSPVMQGPGVLSPGAPGGNSNSDPLRSREQTPAHLLWSLLALIFFFVLPP
jgi:hypothetical protein